MTLQASTVATAIANLNISGLRIKNLTSIPQLINPRECPVMVPEINFITNFLPVPKNLDGTNGYWESTRELNYFVCYTQAGQGRGIFEYVKGMVDIFDALATAVLSADVSGVDIVGMNLSGFGIIKDTDNKEYYGFAIKIVISELVNQ